MGEPNKKPQFPDRPNASKFVLIIVGALLFFTVFLLMSENPKSVKKIAYSEFLNYLDGIYKVNYNNQWITAKWVKTTDRGNIYQSWGDLKDENRFEFEIPAGAKSIPYIKVHEVVFRGVKRIEGIYIQNNLVNNEIKKSEGINFVTQMPYPDPFLLKRLEDQKIMVTSEMEEANTGFFSIILSALPYILLFGLIWFFFFRQVQGNNNRAFNFVKSKAKLYKGAGKKTTFGDVAGVEEAKEELKEIVDFLREPEKFIKMGARIPKGVLLVGPPGTGKTLLAKAIAGEANRPFYSISGSEFVEMFVGVGASRVRDLFETAKKDAPCILFIDELDAVGRMRGAGLGGGNDEREQTLNQILVELDGFDNKETIIVIGATNRPDILDPALLRPGRFDRQIVVDKPDLRGREAILKIHTKDKPLAPSVRLDITAKGTPGFSGADLENMVNEATLIAARKNKNIIELDDFEEARDKIMMGPQRKSMLITEEDKIKTAYHEAGHTIVGYFVEDSDPLHKVTIIPRGRALGVTHYLPEKDHWTYSKSQLLAKIATLLGGRVAEEIRYGKDYVHNGATNDLQRATELSKAMVCQFGMSEKMGPLTYGKDDSPIFIGKEMGRYKDYSEETAREIDTEVKNLILSQYKLASAIVEKNKDKLDLLVKALVEKETLNLKEIQEILGDKEPLNSQIKKELLEK